MCGTTDVKGELRADQAVEVGQSEPPGRQRQDDARDVEEKGGAENYRFLSKRSKRET